MASAVATDAETRASRESVGARVDPYLAAALTVIVGLGIVMVYSSSAVFAARNYGSSTHFLVAQTLRVAVGLVAMYLAMQIPRDVLRDRSGWLFLVATLLCIAVLIPGVGHAAGGARRWLQFAGFTLQPSELAKLAIVVSMAACLSRLKTEGRHWREHMPHVLVMQVPILLIVLEPDFGTAVVSQVIVLALIFAGGLRLRYVLVLTFAGLPIVYHLLMRSYRLKRIIAWLSPLEHKNSIGYQLTEALISIGSGGVTGVGLGESRQKLFFLPEAHTDFIFAILAEELGFIGVCVLLVAFAVLLIRGTRAALNATDRFDAYLALGIVCLIGIPAVFNLGVVTGLLPTKGLPLPLVSYGGSNIVVTLGAMGLLLGISKGSTTQ